MGSPADQRSHRALSIALGASFALSLTAVAVSCGDGDHVDPEAQPAPDVTVFVSGEFGEIPLHPDSHVVASRTVTDRATAQSFLVADVTPRAVVRFYETALDDWDMVGVVRSVGRHAYRAEWSRGNRTLAVSAAPSPAGDAAFEGQADFISQYSLHLHEA